MDRLLNFIANNDRAYFFSQIVMAVGICAGVLALMHVLAALAQ